MSLLEKFENGGSQYVNQLTPKYNGLTHLDPATLAGSQLDLNGQTPTPYNMTGKLNPDTLVSQLDLNGVTPPKYMDNLPK